MNDVFSALLARGVSLFGQGDRLLRLRFASGRGFSEETLLPHRLHGEEGLSVNYRYELECLSADAHLELKRLLGQPVEIGVLLPDGGERLLTGLVTRAEQAGADGGFARYRLTIEPALATLAHRRNSRVFSDKTVPDIVDAILTEHRAANSVFLESFDWRNDLKQTYPTRSYCLQYRESDLAFIERLLAEEGISWRYLHGTDPDTSRQPESCERRRPEQAPREDAATDDADKDAAVPVHTLVLFDDNAALPQSPVPTARFHRTNGVEPDDAIDVWEGARQVRSGQSTLLTYDYKNPSPFGEGQPTWADHGAAGDALASTLEDYDPQTLYYGTDPDELGRYAALRQRAKDLSSKTFKGGGTLRHLEPGTWFELQDHPIHDQDAAEDREFLVTGHTFDAENNLIPEAKSALGGLASHLTGVAPAQATPPYRNTFTAVRRHIPVVPEYAATRHQKPTAPGGTTATVVGPAGEEIFTDEHGRIKIQFHWQRPADHPEGGADYDDKSSTWVRVAMPSAGAGWGSQYTPRIGQEVLVTFLENDIDRPLVTGVVYNGTHRPPTFSGAGQLPANKTLSGIKSKEYKGSRYNELLFDDTTGEIRAKLSSEHGKTQLNQGYLIHPRTDGQGAPRGEGFELRTDHHGAIRAAQGLLLATDARAKAQGNQLDRSELIGLLGVLENLQHHLAELATAHEADATDTEKLTELKQHVENWEKGTNTQGGQPDPAGGQPIIAATAPAGFVVGSAANIALTAESHIDLVSNQNIQMSTGRRWLVRATESLSLFVHRAHMKLIAAEGKIDIQAHNNNIEATAAKEIILTGLEKIALNAPEIALVAEGARIDIGRGKVTVQCTGTYEQKAGFHKLTGPGDGAVGGQLPSSDAAYDEKFKLRFNNGQPVANTPAIIKDGRGKTLWQGVTNAQGEAEILKKDLPENLRIEFGKHA